LPFVYNIFNIFIVIFYSTLAIYSLHVILNYKLIHILK